MAAARMAHGDKENLYLDIEDTKIRALERDLFSEPALNKDPARQALATAVQENPQSLEAWYRLLLHDTEHVSERKEGISSVIRCYERATQCISEQNHSDDRYSKLWLNYVSLLQASEMREEARDVIRYMRNQRICTDKKEFYEIWAKLEKEGEKVRHVIARAIHAGVISNADELLRKDSDDATVVVSSKRPPLALLSSTKKKDADGDTITFRTSQLSLTKGTVDITKLAEDDTVSFKKSQNTPNFSKMRNSENVKNETLQPTAPADEDTLLMPPPSNVRRKMVTDNGEGTTVSIRTRSSTKDSRKGGLRKLGGSFLRSGAARVLVPSGPDDPTATIDEFKEQSDMLTRKLETCLGKSDVKDESVTKPTVSNRKEEKPRPVVNERKSVVVEETKDTVVEMNQRRALKPIIPLADSTPSRTSANNYISVNGKFYLKLGVVGRGGSAKVFRVLGPDKKIWAIKRVNLGENMDSSIVESFVNEIELLRRLRGRESIVHLEDAQVDLDIGVILMVMEFGETDLSRLLQRQQKRSRIDMNFIRLYFQQMVEAVRVVHEEMILHSDLKPSNFLMVRGQLKLIDFGIASAIPQQCDTTHIEREGHIGTLNYMAPEAIERQPGSHTSGSSEEQKSVSLLGRASDTWALGCILYQMVYGKPPFASLAPVSKLRAIVDPRHEIKFPPVEGNPFVVDLLRRCLRRNPKERPRVAEINEHSFLSDKEKPQTRPILSRDQIEKLVDQFCEVGGVNIKTPKGKLMKRRITEELQSGKEIDIPLFIKKYKEARDVPKEETPCRKSISVRSVASSIPNFQDEIRKKQTRLRHVEVIDEKEKQSRIQSDEREGILDQLRSIRKACDSDEDEEFDISEQSSGSWSL